jgi:hypothetical protein
MHICATTPIPDFNSLYNAALPAMTAPLPLAPITIPPLPSLPSPIYPGFTQPNIEILQIVLELQNYQFLTTFSAFITPLVNFLGLNLSAILPKIPGTNLSLLDLLALTPNVVVPQFTAAWKLDPTIFMAIPNSIYYAMNSPGLTDLKIARAAVQSYFTLLIDFVVNLINQAIGKINQSLPALPTIPTIPTMVDLQLLAVPFIPGLPPSTPGIPGLPPVPSVPGLPVVSVGTILAYLNKFSLNNLLSLIAIPGFPAIPSLPTPLVPNFTSPEYNFYVGLEVAFNELVAYPMSIIMNFINSVLSHFIGFSFPTICLDF